MKHTSKVTLLMVLLFFIAQVVGLFITGAYIDAEATDEKGEVTYSALPYSIERPPIEQKRSFIFIITAILIGTVLALLLIKFKKTFLWKIWFFLAVFLCLSIALAAFIAPYVALALSLILALYKIFRPNVFIHNITEVFIYGGLAAIFVPIMNLFAVVILLVLISIYDYIAVNKIKHMVTLAKFQTKTKVFAGLFIPYERETAKEIYEKPKKAKHHVVKTAKIAVLGGGDIGFPLIFSGVVMSGLILENSMLVAFLKTLIIPVFTSVALYILLMKGEKDKFYPAMPFLSAGCFLGFFVLWLINFL
ncbi:MAG: presenilin family intramembrane aspartyl protease [Nanoarchaeota archaeon]|nr:presenilin family intramembrane aspartyl protease [Nanoarchaeota archaeon]